MIYIYTPRNHIVPSACSSSHRWVNGGKSLPSLRPVSMATAKREKLRLSAALDWMAFTLGGMTG